MNIPPLRTYIPSFIEIEGSIWELRENILITSCVEIVLTAMRFKWLSRIMNIPPLRTYIPRFITIERSIYELREKILITYWVKIVLTAMRLQWLSHIMNIPQLRTLYRVLLKSSNLFTNYDTMYYLRPVLNSAYCVAISMVITYNEYPSTENIYTEFYWNRENHLGITRKFISYVLY
jgi:hypothetical protein